MALDPSSHASIPAGLAEPAFDPNALRVLNERYFAKHEDGTLETPREFLWRVASSIAEPEAPYAEKLGRDATAVKSEVSRAFYDMLARRDFMPNTPCLVNAGRPLSMLSACFVLPVPDSIEGIFYNMKAMALIQKSGGGCVSADSRVWTTFCGLEPIEVLFNRATADGRSGAREGGGVAYDVRDLGIRTVSMNGRTGATALKPVTHVWKFDVAAESQVVVRTREGVEVQTSSWHPFMILRGREFVESRADQLAPGDVILGPGRPDELWPFADYRSVAGLEIDEAIGWLIGFTLGDGSFGYVPALRQERLRWSSCTDGVLDRVREILASRGIHVGMSRDRRGETRCVTTLNQEFVAAMFAACGFQKRGPKDSRIRIPEHIAKSPLPVVRAFVAGLIDSDGTVDADGSPSYTTASEEMARDLSALMSLLGYQPTLRRKAPHGRGKLPAYTVLLTPLPRVDELANDVAPYMASTARKERLRSNSTTQSALTIPFAYWRDLLYSQGLVQMRGVKGSGPVAAELNRWICNAAGRVARADLTRISEALASRDAEASELLLSLARRGQEIESVTTAEKPMPYYDLTVEEWNTYASGRTGLALIHNTGFAFSELRHQGAEVQTTGRDASGPVSFMKVFNAATDSIKQGGVRRGANMGVLRCDHPDIFHFMRCKKELDAENRALFNRLSDSGRYSDVQLAIMKQELLQTQINNFNISVGVTDKFMSAVESDGDFELVDPRTKQIVRTVKAREIWEQIVDGAWQNGEPGVLFLDHPDWNPLPGLGPIQATNPCVPASTWVHTAAGPRQVKDLVGIPFEALVDGSAYASSNSGFFFTGVKKVHKVRTDRGYELFATDDHPVLVVSRVTRDVRETRWKSVGELQPGDRVVLHDHRQTSDWAGKGTFEDGLIVGHMLSDGSLRTDEPTQFSYQRGPTMRTTYETVGPIHMLVEGRDFAAPSFARTPIVGAAARQASLAAAFGVNAQDKAISPQVEQASSLFYRGFLRSWFNADGALTGNEEVGVRVRLRSHRLDDLRVAQRMLLRLGIAATLHADRRREKRSDAPGNELVVAGTNLETFRDRIGFDDVERSEGLERALFWNAGSLSRERFSATVVAVEETGIEPVFDCTVPAVSAFDANGLYVHNCGEQALHGYDSCNLGSINLGNYYDAASGDVQWNRLAESTALAIRFLDNVIDANIYPLDEIRDMVTSNRRVGLGIMGFADLLIRLQIPYGSAEAIKFAGKLMKFIRDEAEKASELLARERGEFANKHLSVYKDDPRPRRNSALLSIAPTGTISMIAGCSFGCEPYFGMAYTKHVMKDAEGRPQHLYYVVPVFEEISQREGFYSEALLGQIEENRGSLKGLDSVPPKWQEIFTVAADVTVNEHIDMLAAFQKSTCNAVSKTVNAPNDDTRDNVAKAIFRAYKSGCKGFTYYRDGSRTEQVVTFSKDGDLKDGNRDVAGSSPVETVHDDELLELLAQASELVK